MHTHGKNITSQGCVRLMFHVTYAIPTYLHTYIAIDKIPHLFRESPCMGLEMTNGPVPK